MRVVSLIALALSAAPAAAQEQDRPGQTADPIVVTGTRISDYRARLEACLARNCPPNEDIDATLALAEVLFEAGEYRDARQAIAASLRRNRDEARGYPEPVSDLYRASARVARHLGNDSEASQSTRGILQALRQGIPQEDHRHFTARLEISEHLIATGNYVGAQRELADLGRRASRAGRQDVADVAELRSLWVGYVADPRGPSRSRLIELSRSTDPANLLKTIGSKILLARIFREEGDIARSDALIAEIGRRGSRRALLYSPPYELAVRENFGPGGDITPSSITTRLSDNFEDAWIDVGFWVQSDGRVAGLEILRKGASTGWAGPLLESIRGRVYSPSTDNVPTYRLERYTYTAGYEIQTGSRLPRRSPRARVEYFDLTDEPDAAPPSGG